MSRTVAGFRPLPPPPPVDIRSPMDEEEALILRQVEVTRRKVATVEIAWRSLVLLGGVIAYGLLAAVVDQWVYPRGMPNAVRWVLWSALIAGSLVWIVFSIGPYLIRRIHPVFAAYLLEQAVPTLKHSLISFVLLRREKDELRDDPLRLNVFRGLEKNTAQQVSRVSPETVVDRKSILYAGYGLIALVALFAALVILSPKNPLVSAARAMVPWSQIPPPSRVRIDTVQPGNAEVLQGERVVVSATIYGLRPGEEPRVVYSTADGQLVDQSIPLVLTDKILSRYECELTPSIQQPTTYRILAGDSLTPEYRLTVVIPLRVKVRKVEYKFPAYTKLEPRTVEDLGDIQALEGTEITIHAEAPEPLRHAQIILQGDQKGVLGMAVQGTTATASTRLRLTKPGSYLREFSVYQIRAESVGGRPSVNPVKYTIEVVPDMPPMGSWVEPTETRLVVPVNGSLPLRLRAEDPDFGLRRVVLSIEALGRKVAQEALLEKSQGESHTGEFTAEYHFVPKQLNLATGDIAICRVEISDNREPTANVVTLPELQIRIGDPEEGARSEPQPSTPEQKSPSAGRQPEEGSPQRPGGQPQPPSPDQPSRPEQQERRPDQATPPPQAPQGTGGGEPAQSQAPTTPGNIRDQTPPPGQAEQSRGEDRPPQGENEGRMEPQESKQGPTEGQSTAGGTSRDSGGATQGSPQPRESSGEPTGGSHSGSQAAGPEGSQTTGDSPMQDRSAGEEGRQTGHEPPPHVRGAGEHARPGGSQATPPGSQGAQQPQPAGSQNQGSGVNPGAENAAGSSGSTQGGDHQGGKPSQSAAGEKPEGTSGSRTPAGAGPQGGGQETRQGSGEARSPTGQNDHTQDPGRQGGAAGERSQAQGDQPSGQASGTARQDGNASAREEPGKSNDTRHGGSGSAGGETGGNASPEGSQGQGAARSEPSADSSAPRERVDGVASPGDAIERILRYLERQRGTDAASDGQYHGSGQPGSSGPQGGASGRQSDRDPSAAPQSSAVTQPGAQGEQSGGPATAPSAGQEVPPGASPAPVTPPDRSSSATESGPSPGTPPASSGATPPVGEHPPQSSGDTPESVATPARPGQNDAPQNREGLAGEQSGLGGAGGGQNTPAQGSGGPGSQSPSEGREGSPAAGEGQEAAAGSGSASASGGNTSAGGGGRAGEGTRTGGPQASGAQTGAPGRGAASPPSQLADGPRGGGLPGGGSGGGGAWPGTDTPVDEPNLEFARRQTELVLRYLEDQMARDTPDDQLLKELGWTKEDMARFVKRWQELKKAAEEDTPRGQAARRQLNEILRSLGLKPGGTELRHNEQSRDNLRGLETGRDIPPPPQWSDYFREYLKSLGATR